MHGYHNNYPSTGKNGYKSSQVKNHPKQSNKKPSYQTIKTCAICGKEFTFDNAKLCKACADFMRKKLLEDV